VRVAAQMWYLSFAGFLGGTRFGIDLPRIHPLEVIGTITGGNFCV
jgi:hypothetical protein